MIPTKAINLLIELWPMLALFLIVLITLRLVYLKVNHKRFVLYKELLSLSFIIYILLLFELVTSTDFESYSNNFIPFKEMFRYSLTSKLFYRNVIGNILLFVPFGFFASYYLNNKKASVITIVTLIVSGCAEGMQYYLGRVFDIDDIILNLVGGIVGFLIYVGLDAIKNKIKLFKNDTILDILIIIILVLVMLYSFNINVFDVIGG